MIHYATSAETENGYRGRIYRYDSTGEREITVHRIPEERETAEQAIDDAVEWCERNGIECEIDF